MALLHSRPDALPARLRRLGARWRRDARGVTAIEFGMLLFPFLFAFFAILETTLFMFSQQSMQSAVENAQRVIMTGQQQGRPVSPAQAASDFKAALCADMVALFDCKALVKVDVRVGPPQNPNAYLRPDGGFDDAQFGFDPGVRNSIVTVTAMAAYPLFVPTLLPQMVTLPNGARLIQASYAFKSEPF